MGVISPNGVGREAFADAILRGQSGVRRIMRFDVSHLPVRIAGECVDFDESRWIDARERKHVSRVVPLSIAASDEALRDARIDPCALSLEEQQQIGVSLGTGGGSGDFSEAQYELYFAGKVKSVSLFSIPSGTWGTLSSEISMRYGLRGPSHVVTTGCTSSTDAVAHAFNIIRLGTIPMMLAGGVDSPLMPGLLKGFTLMKIMTESHNDDPERASRPFSKDRDGFVVAEGSWMFVLEELEHARLRGAHIYAEVAGYGSTCEAFHRVRLQECGEEPARAMQLAMQEAQIAPDQIGYVALHGTSTLLNDRIETRAVKLALGEEVAYRTPMSAIKSQIGHPQGASGAAGIAASLIAMREQCIPPTINLDIPDPDCDLDYVAKGARRSAFEYALCNCIAFGSKNSALVLRKFAE